MTMNKLYGKLRSHNKKNYVMLVFCIILSVMLITSYGLIYFSPTVQVILPTGGDSRKMADMVFAAAILGCGIFTVYAGSLFYKYKSREMGIFMALGAPKEKLRKVLFTDLILVILLSCAAGLVAAFPIARGIWGLFQAAIIDTREMTYHIGWTGVAVGVVFSVFVCVSIFLMAVRFLARTNIIEVLNDARISEPVKDVKSYYLPLGIGMIIVGFLVSYYGYSVTEKLIGYRIRGVWNIFYLLCVAGVYLLMVYIVVHAKRGRHPEKYYKNIISTSMMRFMGRQTVRNMCVIVLLVFGGLFTVNYVPVISATVQETVKSMEKDFLFTYPSKDQQITKQEIEKLAEEHRVSIKDYYEMSGISLILDGTTDITDKRGKVTEIYEKQLWSTMFYKASDIEQIVGKKVDVKQGRFRRIVRSSRAVDGEREKIIVTDPVTLQETPFQYDGYVMMYNSLIRSVFDGNNIVLNDKDYDSYFSHLDMNYKYQTVSFNVTDWEASYKFASELKNQIIQRTPKENAVVADYDWFAAKKNEEQGKSYFMNEEYPPGVGSLKLSPDNSQLSSTWRYYPDFRVLQDQDMIKNMAVMLMLFIYIAIVCMAAVGIIAYTRGLSIAMNYRQIFVDLRRLGANRNYILFCIKGQLRKVFFYPFLVGVVLCTFFILMIFMANDGVVSHSEMTAFGIDLLIYAGIFGYIYVVYYAAFSKFKKIVGVEDKENI